MRTNTARKFEHVQTAGGSPAYPHLKPIDQLRRTVLACMLFENGFYEDGQTVADRIKALVAQCTPAEVADLAFQARTEQNLRHVPLLLAVALARGPERAGLSLLLPAIIQRPDELSEFLSLYWADGRVPLAAAVKKGLAKAFAKFDAYALAKYNRDDAIKLRDVLFLTHAKPKDEAQAAVWKQLVDGTLPSPDTWEVALSTGGNKREEFTRLLTEGKLGYLALLRNLRGMTEAGVESSLIRDAILARKGGAERVLPFRYVAAARACPQLEPAIDQALSEAISALAPLSGHTVVMVDVSPSMDVKLSGKSDLSRKDAAAALASLINGNVRMFSFSNEVVEVPPRRGMAGVDAILKSQRPNGTRLFDAIAWVNEKVPYDRIIVITDEQDTGGNTRTCPNPKGLGYMINVATDKNGVGYGAWTHIDGFSESILKWITESERAA